MIDNFRVISLSHKNAPVEVREVFALDKVAQKKLLWSLKDNFSISEALILSTCNRTEVYYIAEKDLSKEIANFISLSDKYSNYFESITPGKPAVEHLFNVSMGLESQVLGDLQIINQVKNSYQNSADTEMAGPIIHRLMHTIFYANKRATKETGFRDGAASVSYACSSIVRDLVGTNLADSKVLVIGLGEIGEDVVRNLKSAGLNNVTICNRTEEKSQALSSEMGFRFVSFDKWKEELLENDVIVSAVTSIKPIIDKSFVQSLNEEDLSFKHFIDLSVPRSIDSNIVEVSGITLYNIDHIKEITSQTLKNREKEISSIKSIIDDSTEEFLAWSHEASFSSAITKFKSALEQIRQEELTKYLKKTSPEEKHLVEKVTKGIINKIIKLPVLQLKAACKRGEAEELAELLQNLFIVENEQITN